MPSAIINARQRGMEIMEIMEIEKQLALLTETVFNCVLGCFLWAVAAVFQQCSSVAGPVTLRRPTVSQSDSVCLEEHAPVFLLLLLLLYL